jgi:hypothetical protein
MSKNKVGRGAKNEDLNNKEKKIAQEWGYSIFRGSQDMGTTNGHKFTCACHPARRRCLFLSTIGISTEKKSCEIDGYEIWNHKNCSRLKGLYRNFT